MEFDTPWGNRQRTLCNVSKILKKKYYRVKETFVLILSYVPTRLGNVTMKDFKKKEDNSKMVLHRFTRQVTSNKPFENSTKIRLILRALRRYVKTPEPGTFARVDCRDLLAVMDQKVIKVTEGGGVKKE